MSSELIATISTGIGLAVFIRIGNVISLPASGRSKRATGGLRERVARLEGKLDGLVAARRDCEVRVRRS